MQTTSLISIVYGAMIALGGMMGYAKAQSVESLLTGVASGAALIVAGLVMRRGIRAGLGVALLVTVGLIAFFVPRYLQSQKMMPAGMTVILSIIALVAMIVTARKTSARDV